MYALKTIIYVYFFFRSSDYLSSDTVLHFYGQHFVF